MKIGIVTGTFDILHAGHIHFLRQARSKCDRLIVALHADPTIERPTKNKPIESLLQREIKLTACKFVDGVIVYEKEEDLPRIFKYFNINIRFLGSDYMDGKKQISYPDLIKIDYIDSIDIHSNDYH